MELLPNIATQAPSAESSSKVDLIVYCLLLTISIAIFQIISNANAAFLSVDVLFCAFLMSQFTNKARIFFMIHPPALLLIWQFYSDGVYFQSLGDGDIYYEVVRSYLPFYTAGSWSDVVGNVPNYEVRSLYIGMIPNIIVPDYYYPNAPDSAYFFWQATFFVVLMSGITLLAKYLRIFRDDMLFAIVLFSIISPSFLVNTVVPHRHYVTFCSVVVVYVSVEALFRKFNIVGLVALLVGLGGIFLSKAAYFAPLGGYIALRIWASGSLTMQHVVLFAPLVFGLGALALSMDLFFGYSEHRVTSVSTAANFGGVPLANDAFKILGAFLAPFPWLKYSDHLPNFGGNGLIFLLHMLSCLTGLYLFFVVIGYRKEILARQSIHRYSTLYALVMSSSILWGAAGFHGYLSIFFPFFAPLLQERRYRIYYGLPIIFVFVAEFFYWLT